MQQSGDWKKSGRKEQDSTSIIMVKRRRRCQNEIGAEVRSQAEKDQTSTEATEDDPNEMLYANPIPESEQVTDVEEGEVTEETKSESETIAYEQSEEEEREVVPEKVPIQGEVSWEVSNKKTRSGRVVKRPEWQGQNNMISAIEQKKPKEEEPEK